VIKNLKKFWELNKASVSNRQIFCLGHADFFFIISYHSRCPYISKYRIYLLRAVNYEKKTVVSYVLGKIVNCLTDTDMKYIYIFIDLEKPKAGSKIASKKKKQDPRLTCCFSRAKTFPIS
jgi:hypothetical protein